MERRQSAPSERMASVVAARTGRYLACPRPTFHLAILPLLLALLSCRAEADVVDEVKLGGLYHGILSIPQREAGGDVNAEVLFTAPGWFLDDKRSPWLNALLDPRPEVGISANTAGYTTLYYFGLNWQTMLYPEIAGSKNGLYTAFSFGGCIHNGKLDNRNPRWNALGSRILFHLSAELGYAFDDHYSAAFYFEHASNGGIARWNQSLNNAGVRLGYRF